MTWSEGDPLTPSNLNNKANAPVYNVKDFGAVGDGSTDDTAAVQTAINAAEAAGGGTVLLPSGSTYTVSDQGAGFCMRIDSDDVRILAHGATVQLADSDLSGSAITNLLLVGDGTTATSGSRSQVVGGTWDGNRANNSSTGDIVSGSVIRARGPLTDLVFRDLRIIGGTRGGLALKGESAASRLDGVDVVRVEIDNCAEGSVWQFADNVTFRECSATNMTDQDCIEPASGCKGWQILNCFIANPGPGNTGIDVFPNTAPTEAGLIAGCTLTAGTSISLNVGGGDTLRDVTVRDCKIEGSSVLIGDGGAATVERVAVIDCFFDGQSVAERGIHVRTSTTGRIVIRGNTVFDCGLSGIFSDADDVVINGNVVFHNGQDTGASVLNRCGIAVEAGENIVSGNRIFDDQGTTTQQFGARLGSDSVNTLLHGNIISSNATNIREQGTTNTQADNVTIA